MNINTNNAGLKLSEDNLEWVLFNIKHTKLAIKQSEVVSIMIAADVIDAEKNKFGSAWFEYDGEKWPAYNLNAQMMPMANISDDRKFCVILRKHDQMYGIMCDQIKTLYAEDSFDVQPMPSSLGQKHSPFDRLGQLNDEIFSICGAVSLVEYIHKISQLVNRTGAGK